MKYLKLSVYEFSIHMTVFLYSSIFIHATYIALDRLPTHTHIHKGTHTHTLWKTKPNATAQFAMCQCQTKK